ncbi:hypothetical protein [Massilia timonae]|uniref:hypothetical protein n=1 Tax=Massilia timonae TaxID=47229 RepID=UPI0028A1F228|nr:hypothetical protein [Massilia timonae]
MSRIDFASPYRVQGTITSFGELAKKNPDVVYKMPDELVAEARLHDEQMAARLEAGRRYADLHPDKIHAQITLGGKTLATIYDSGVTHLEREAYGAQPTNDGEGLALADARIADILKAIPGEVKYRDLTDPGGRSARAAPASALPKVTARSLMQILQDLDWKLARARIDEGTPGA